RPSRVVVSSKTYSASLFGNLDSRHTWRYACVDKALISFDVSYLDTNTNHLSLKASPHSPLQSCFRCCFVESAGIMKIGISGLFHNCLSAIASFATDVHTPFFCNWLIHFLPFAVGCWYIPCCIRWVRIIELSIPLKYSLNFLQS